MSLPALDKRLSAAAELVRNGSAAADIGTDHGYLISALVASGKCPRGFACDINEMPLEKARSVIENLNLSDKIECVLTNGLDGLEGKGITEFLILGMGGDLISEIISRHSWVKNPENRFILQPMTKADHLRRNLYADGFSILSETAVISGKFAYSVLLCEYTGTVKAVSELFAWMGLIFDQNDADSLRYLEIAGERIKKKAVGLSESMDGNLREEAKKYLDLYNTISERSRTCRR